MMRCSLILAVVTFLTGCVTSEMSSLTKENSFNGFVDRYYEEYLRFYPLEATQMADNRYNDLMLNPVFWSPGRQDALAIRLVVDVGLHAKGWSREEAIRYSTQVRKPAAGYS